MKKLLQVGFVWVAVLTMNGCATMFSESTDPMTFDSVPQGATVTFDGKYLGKTPFSVNLPRKTDSTAVTFRLDGYAPQTVNLARNVAGPAWLNLGFITTTSGVTSWGIDAASGKLLTYSPHSYVIQLESVNAPATKPSKGSSSKDSSTRAPKMKVTPLEYVISNHNALRSELAMNKGEFFNGLCDVYQLNQKDCRDFYGSLRARNSELVRQPDSLAWYRSMTASVPSKN